MDILINILVGVGISLTVAVLGWIGSSVRKTLKISRDTDALMNRGLTVLLRNQLISAHRRANDSRSMSVTERQSYHEMHDLYTGLGGNGMASHLNRDVATMAIVHDENIDGRYKHE